MQMCASSRVVVVLPLVPVTEATGMRGVTRRGPSPSGDAAATVAARSATASGKGRPGEEVARAPARWLRPGPPRRARWRQTKAQTTTSVSLAARVRTPSRRVPTSVASARATRSTSAQQHLLALLGPRCAGLATAQPCRGRDRAQGVDGGVEVAGQRERHLDGRAGEVEVRPLEDAHLAGDDAGPGLAGVRGLAAHPGSLVGDAAGAGAPRRRTPRHPWRGSRRRRAPSRRSWRGTSPRAGRRRPGRRARRR